MRAQRGLVWFFVIVMFFVWEVASFAQEPQQEPQQIKQQSISDSNGALNVLEKATKRLKEELKQQKEYIKGLLQKIPSFVTEDEFNKLKENVTEIQKDILSLKEDVKNLDAVVEALSNDLKYVKEKLVWTSDSLVSFKEDFTKFKSEIEADFNKLSGRGGTFEKAVKELVLQVSENKGRVKQLYELLANLKENIKNRYSTLESKIKSLDKTDLDNASNISSLENKIKDLTFRLNMIFILLICFIAVDVGAFIWFYKNKDKFLKSENKDQDIKELS